ncbi:MAG: 1-deoxy-D-xylulose-5-phosphate synthase [Actinomycetota bacterium]
MLLDQITGPADLRQLDDEQLRWLAGEIREFIVDAVSRTGGHLGSNLGAVELTLALHRVFDSPRDVIIWDTGHQAYVHKLVTGRRDDFTGLRQREGLSGYPCREESEHDWVENSHASTSLSWAHGLSTAFAQRGEDRRVIAVIGDGSMTGGMAYEALNNLGHSGNRCIIVLNDNGRSYAPTIGKLSENVVRLRLDPRYVSNKQRAERLIDRLPLGRWVNRSLRSAAAGAREFFEPPAFFETLGVRYVGPIDGHDIDALEQAFELVADYDGPIVVHAITRKGKGYEPAELDEEKNLHDTGLFDPNTGEGTGPSKGPDFTKAFSEVLLEEGTERPELVAITAAMPGSTGMLPFAEAAPDRVIDVGIAEQHAITAAAGMAAGGLRPVVALYSTFFTRAVDQMTFDVGLHGLPVVLCLDRAGITGPDGASHHGIFDLALLSRIPGITILAPSSYEELQAMFRTAMDLTDGPVALRWSRGTAPRSDEIGSGLAARRLREGTDVCLLGVGPMVWRAEEAAELLADQGVSCSVWDARAVRPLDPAMLEAAADHRLVVTVEDGEREGGFGSAVQDALARLDRSAAAPRVVVLGIPVEFLPHAASPAEIHADLGLDTPGIAASTFKAWNAQTGGASA